MTRWPSSSQSSHEEKGRNRLAFLTRLIDPNEREVRQHLQVASQIGELEPKLESLADAALRTRSDELRQRAEPGEDLDHHLIEGFALVREAARRTIGQRHFEVQQVRGPVLPHGKNAEIKTRPGKPPVA